MGLTVPVAGLLASSCGNAPRRAVTFLPARQAVAPRAGLPRIAVLGDSIAAQHPGFRMHLADWLWTNNETRFTFVGSQPSTGPSPAGPLVHEGHGGWDCTQLYDLVQGGVLSYPEGTPNLTVLVAGANDMDDGVSAAGIYAKLRRLMLATLAYTETVVVCEQAPMSSYNNHQLTDNTRRQQQLNDMLPELVSAADPGRVIIAKTSQIGQSGIDPYGVHPNDAGARGYAAGVYYSLAPVFGSAGHMVPIDPSR